VIECVAVNNATTISVVDFRRQTMVLQWHALGGTWTAWDIPPVLVHGIALIRVQATELVFDVDTGLATQVDQVLTFDVKFSRQGINTGFLLQAELLYSDLPQPPINRTRKPSYFLF